MYGSQSIYATFERGAYCVTADCKYIIRNYSFYSFCFKELKICIHLSISNLGYRSMNIFSFSFSLHFIAGGVVQKIIRYII